VRRRGLELTVVTALVLLAGLPAAAQSPRPAAPVDKKAPTKPGEGQRPDGKSEPVTVDADRMERYGKESLVVFIGNVVARQNNSVQYTDRMEVYLDEKEDRILRTVSTGNVRIVTRDCRTGTVRRAEYYDLEQRLVLIGNARVWQEDNVVSGETITMFLSQDRSVVVGGQQERVKAVFYPRENPEVGADGQTARADGRPAATKPPQQPCKN
jgi:lipopolysaccharide export system protein LptA